MAVTNWMRGTMPLAAAAVLTGAMAAVLPTAGLILLAATIGLCAAVALIRFRAGEGRVWHPVLTLLTSFAVLMVAWNGAPPKSVAAPDLLLVAALAALAFCWVQDSVEIPIPGWLVGTAALLISAQLLDQFFLVTHPPQDQPPSFTPVGPPLLTLFRVELGMLVLPLVVGAVASTWQRANLLANLWVLSATVSAAVGAFDSATGAGIGVSITGLGGGEAGRVSGLSIHPNALALTCCMALPIALLRAAQLRGLGRAAAVGASGILIIGVLASGSRVGVVGVALAVGLTGMLIARLRTRILAAGMAAIVAFGVVAAFAPSGSSLFSGIDRLEGSGSASGASTQRFDQLHESIHLAWGHPFTGIGFQVISDAHNLWVQVWETAGLFGILALLLYVIGVFHLGWRLYREAALPRGSPEFVGALTVSFAIWLVSGFLQNPIADRYIYVPVGLLLGMGLVAKARRAEGHGSEPAEVSRPAATTTSRISDGAKRVPVAS
jgi:O-antigen ligase